MHWPSVLDEVAGVSDIATTYTAVVLFESFFALGLFVLLGYVYVERRTVSYRWLWIASMTLVVRSLVGVAQLVVDLEPMVHMTVDHGLDIVLIGAVLYAVYHARSVTTTP